MPVVVVGIIVLTCFSMTFSMFFNDVHLFQKASQCLVAALQRLGAARGSSREMALALGRSRLRGAAGQHGLRGQLRLRADHGVPHPEGGRGCHEALLDGWRGAAERQLRGQRSASVQAASCVFERLP